MINKFVDFLIDKRKIILLMAFLIAVAGLYSYYLIPKQENPDTSVAAAVITTVYPGATPTEVEKNVTDIIEEELDKLEDIDYYSSSSLNSASVVVIMYDMEFTIEDVEDDLYSAIDKSNENLPELAEKSVINTDVVPNNQFIISLSGQNYSDSELVEYAQTVQGIIAEVEGIDTVTIDGEKEMEVVIEVDNSKMKTYGISIESVLQLLQAQNLSIPTGSIEYEDTTISVTTPAIFESIKDIENTVVAGSSTSLSFVKLKDIASVYIDEQGDYAYYQDGNNAILLTGTIVEGENAVLVGNDLREAIAESKTQLPDDLTFHEAMYAPQDIENSVNSFVSNLIQSIILIIIVVMIGVRLKNAIVISVSLPLSILSTFIVMYLLQIEFQFISIAALIVSLGILVDNAIVMSEAIQQNLNKGLDKKESIVLSIKQNATPIFSSTLTTVVTFSTIYFVPGVVGRIAGTIPTVVIASLVASYFVSMIVTPILAYMYFEPENSKKLRKVSKYKIFIDKLLSISLNHKLIVIILSFCTLGISVLLASTLGLQFFPVASKPVAYINFEGEGMSLQSSKSVVEQINEVLDDNELIDNYTYSVGKGLPSFFLTIPTMTTAPNVGQYMLQLNEEILDSEYIDISEATRYIQSELDNNVSGATTYVKNLEYSMPSEAKIAFSVSGDPDRIQEVAEEMTLALGEIEGTDNVRNTIVESEYDYEVKLDSDELSSYGLSKYDVLKQMNTSLMGAHAGIYQGGGSNMEIILKSNIQSLDDLSSLLIMGSVTDTKVALSQISEITISPSIPLIEHYNGENFVYVLSDILPTYSSLAIEDELGDVLLDDLDMDGIEISGHGEVKNMLDLITDLGFYAIIAVLVIYMILYTQFRKHKMASIVLATIPLSLIGCGLGLRIFDMDIQVMAILGLVSLFGIVVNNGILLVEVMKENHQSGMLINDACISAVDERYRPIFMSSLTTCIGLVPLILSGDAMIAPMASVLLFGLLFSTMLTMVVVPTLYAYLFRSKNAN